MGGTTLMFAGVFRQLSLVLTVGVMSVYACTGTAFSDDSIQGTTWKGVWRYQDESGEVRIAFETLGRNDKSVIVFSSAPPIEGLAEGEFWAHGNGGIGDNEAEFGGNVGSVAGAPFVRVLVKRADALTLSGTVWITTQRDFEVRVDLRRVDQPRQAIVGPADAHLASLQKQRPLEQEGLTATEAASTEATRLAIAKVARGLALKEFRASGLAVSIKEPKSEVEIREIAIKLNHASTKLQPTSKKAICLDAWRKVFVALMERDEKNSVYLKKSGIDLSSPENAAATATNALVDIATREKAVFIRQTRDSNGNLTDDELRTVDALKYDAGKLYAVDVVAGTKSEIPADERSPPVNIESVERLATMPDNIFPDPRTRQAYLGILEGFHCGRAEWPPDLRDRFAAAFTALKEWYGFQDGLLNDGLTPDEMIRNMERVAEQDIWQSFDRYKRAHFLVTGNMYGPLPTPERLAARLRMRAAEKAKEKPSPTGPDSEVDKL